MPRSTKAAAAEVIQDIGLAKAYLIIVAFVVALFAWALALMNRGTGIRD